MKTFAPSLLLLTLLLLPACTTERGDRIWQIIDPAGYKHAHSESFNGARALRAPQSRNKPASDNMALELDQ